MLRKLKVRQKKWFSYKKKCVFNKKSFFTLKSRSIYLKYETCQISKNSRHFQFWDQFGLTGSKYLIKVIFDIKIKIGMFEISKVPNFNKF